LNFRLKSGNEKTRF